MFVPQLQARRCGLPSPDEMAADWGTPTPVVAVFSASFHLLYISSMVVSLCCFSMMASVLHFSLATLYFSFSFRRASLSPRIRVTVAVKCLICSWSVNPDGLLDSDETDGGPAGRGVARAASNSRRRRSFSVCSCSFRAFNWPISHCAVVCAAAILSHCSFSWSFSPSNASIRFCFTPAWFQTCCTFPIS